MRTRGSDGNAEREMLSRGPDKPLVVWRKYPAQVRTMRIKACAAGVSDDWMCSHACVYVCLCKHEYAFIHCQECPLVYEKKKKKAPVLANKHFCILDSSAMILLVNLSASDSKSLEAIISDKWKLYMKINIKSFVREKIIQLGNKQGTGLRAMLPVIHISTAFKLLKRLEIIIGHIFFPFFSTQMARLGYLTFTSGL